MLAMQQTISRLDSAYSRKLSSRVVISAPKLVAKACRLIRLSHTRLCPGKVPSNRVPAWEETTRLDCHHSSLGRCLNRRLLGAMPCGTGGLALDGSSDHHGPGAAARGSVARPQALSE